MSNAFESFAETTARSPRPRKTRTLLEVQKDTLQVRKVAKAADRAELTEVLAGPHGAVLADVRRVCRRLDLTGAPALVAYIAGAAALLAAPFQVRWLALQAISRAIVRVRVRAGLPPFDDGLFDDPPKALQVIKQLLGVR